MTMRKKPEPHPNLDEARSYREEAGAIHDQIVENVFAQTSNLARLMTNSFQLAACESHLGLDPTAMLRLGVEAGVAIFAAGAVPGKDVTFTIGGRTETRRSYLDDSVAHAGRWETALCGAIVLGDAAATRTLCEIPLARLLASSTSGPRFLGPWVEALRGAATGAFDEAHLGRAFEATDPEKLSAGLRDVALTQYAPAIDALSRIATGDAAALDRALAAGVDKHRLYWAKGKSRNDTAGYVSWPLSALAGLARGLGLAVTATSPYLLRLP
jgi:hypothetical protein